VSDAVVGEFSPSVSPLSIASEILDDLLPQSPGVVHTPIQPLPSVHSMAAGFENEYLELNNTIEIRCSQEAIVNWAQTSTFFLHSVIYRDFFANEVQHRKLSKILATMKHRWGAARGEGQILGTKCHCGQYFKSIIHALSHRNCKNSNCARAKIFQVDACKAIDSELIIPPNLISCVVCHLIVPLLMGLKLVQVL
jgi:hypothetical protein